MQFNAYLLLTGLLLAGAVAGCSADQQSETAQRPAAPQSAPASAPTQASSSAAAAQVATKSVAKIAAPNMAVRKASAQRTSQPKRWVSQSLQPAGWLEAGAYEPILACGGLQTATERAIAEARDSAEAIDLSAFCAQAAPAVQVFQLRPSRDTVLLGQQGTRLVVPARAFEIPANGGPVELRMREFYSTPDIVLAGLGTRAGRDLLETGGMLHLAAAANGQPISLRSGKQIRIQLPTKQQLPGMQLYEGVVNDLSHAPDWRLPSASNPAKARSLPDKAASERWPCLPKGNGTLQPLLDRLAPLSAADMARLSRLRPGSRGERRRWRMIGRNKHLTVSYMLTLALIADSTGAIPTVCLQQGDSVLGNALAAAVKQLPRLRPASYLTAAAPRRRRLVAAQGTLEVLYTRAGQRFVHIDWQRLLKPAGTEKEAQRSRAAFARQFNSQSAPLTFDSGLYYELAAGGLGWINCDRLLDPGPRIEFAVQAPAPATVVSLVFKGQRSILASSRTEGDAAIFEQVPSGQAATIVALRREKGITYLATTAVSLGQATPPDLQFRPVTLDELRTELARL